MVDSVAFKTRARTIDHLGREQIADCPTAISELWKNAYDAYAREVALHIYDGDVPIAALVDDGHGMSHREFIEKWLVVGTESKADGSGVSEEDRKSLPYRPRQGQKGIGRLSSAALGPLLLVVSKRRLEPFVAALIDWRLFENPFIYLHDIEIPVVEFFQQNELLEQLPSMFDRLMGNVWGDGRDATRDARITAAWGNYDGLEKNENRPSTREAIEKVIIGTTFTSRHFQQWSVWTGRNDTGTALLVGDISFDLEAQIDSRISSEDHSAADQARRRLFETLSNFTDPFVDTDEANKGYAAKDFRYSVTAWEGSLSRPVISDEHEFELANLEELEHVVDGQVDDSGIFTGRIKAFGKWLDGEVSIIPKTGVPSRSDSKVGPFHLRLGTYERVRSSSSHTSEVFAKLKEQAEIYAGFMAYRNGLRIMPFGREDNDYFEIEKRHAAHAGREFWANRNTFGRVAITRELNPNLKDKAGREGIIDNKAAKVFRDLVVNILMTTARRYFGTDSDVRQVILPEIQKDNAREKAEEAQRLIRARKRKEFSKNLQKLSPVLAELFNELETYATLARNEQLPNTEIELLELRDRLASLNDRFRELSLGTPPNNLGTLEEAYSDYRHKNMHVKSLIVQLNDTIVQKLELLKPKAPRDIAFSELNRNAAFLHHRLRKWSQEAKDVLNAEVRRISDLVEERNKRYHSEMLPLLDDLEHNRVTLTKALDEMGKEREKQDRENSELFEPYLSTLKSLRDSVDIETLVSFTMEESADIRQELDRLNGLAQLGITVEILGHEIEGLETTISRGLREMSDEVKSSSAFDAIKTAHETLTDRLRFLSPLKLSGEKIKTWISGEKIVGYLHTFFGDKLERNGITLEVSPAFRSFSVYEQISRVHPVFINLVNNASYWVGLSKEDSKKILLDVVDNKIVISDNGPGVDGEDLKHLFSLFFTRKVRGGRGVGLYLCRANLAAGGHTIQYAVDKHLRKLSGANFVIDFKGAKYA
ncbi:MAG: histidine kinase [Proteobacteria bacterium]|nr:histidine kinase [Pseudomonadota bacterium]